MNGRKYAVKNVLYQADGNQVRFTLDLAGAYPDSAQVLKWLRQITFNRNKNIIVQENYQLKQLLRPFTLNLMTTLKPELIRPGIVKLTPFTTRSAHSFAEFYIEYDKNLLDFNFEIIKLTDARLKAAWQNQIVRILLTSRNKSNQGQIKITFHE